jgi:hypothetical protein
VVRNDERRISRVARPMSARDGSYKREEKGLGVPTVRLGNLGRGLRLTGGLKRKIHQLARQLGIDRRCITGIACPDLGYGGVPCPLCEEFGVTGGLRFVDLNRRQSRIPCGYRAQFFPQGAMLQ